MIFANVDFNVFNLHGSFFPYLELLISLVVCVKYLITKITDF